jgi:carboxymethylenebutenolidase
MTVKSEWVRHGAEPHVGYLCYPARAKTPLPSVIVLQEAWGVSAHIEDVTRRFALAGYAAFAPDVFAKGGERPAPLARDRLDELVTFINDMPASGWRDAAERESAIAKRPAAEATRIRESFAAIMGGLSSLAPFMPAVAAGAKWLREECAITRGEKVFSVGFCMGGGLSALLACEDPELAGSVIFYGSSPPLDRVPSIRCKVLAFWGVLDTRIQAQLTAFEQAMRDAGKHVESTAYNGVGHAFFNDDRPSYDAEASRDAFVRTLAFLRAELN